MVDIIYIVLWRDSQGLWRPESDGVFTERRLAENLIECRKAAGQPWEFAIVEGPITSPQKMAEAEASLGPF